MDKRAKFKYWAHVSPTSNMVSPLGLFYGLFSPLQLCISVLYQLLFICCSHYISTCKSIYPLPSPIFSYVKFIYQLLTHVNNVSLLYKFVHNLDLDDFSLFFFRTWKRFCLKEWASMDHQKYEGEMEYNGLGFISHA